MKFVVLFTLVGPLAVMPLTAPVVTSEVGLAGLTLNTGTHGFS